MSAKILKSVYEVLRKAIIGIKKEAEFSSIAEAKDEVLERYQRIFNRDHLPNLSEDEFRSFLLLENNKHWSGLHRQGSRMCDDMDNLREALLNLLDEDLPIELRFARTIDMVKGMGKNIASAILQINSPELFGVWNNRTESVMKNIDIWPTFARGDSYGQQYKMVNDVLLQLCKTLEIDLWTLDTVWWYLDHQNIEEEESEKSAIHLGSSRFGLEKYLQEFLQDNWEHIEISNEWSIYQDSFGEEIGFQYNCANVGRIDILAKHKSEPRWLVIELKRNQSPDATIGQVTRYMGWVKHNLAKSNEAVLGMIVCHQVDKKLEYALQVVKNVSLKLYKVDFSLEEYTPTI